MSLQILSWMMDAFIPLAITLPFIVTNCDEILSWMIEIWKVAIFGTM